MKAFWKRSVKFNSPTIDGNYDHLWFWYTTATSDLYKTVDTVPLCLIIDHLQKMVPATYDECAIVSVDLPRTCPRCLVSLDEYIRHYNGDPYHTRFGYVVYPDKRTGEIIRSVNVNSFSINARYIRLHGYGRRA